MILIGLTYGVYTFFRDYNAFFIDARVFLLFIRLLMKIVVNFQLIKNKNDIIIFCLK